MYINMETIGKVDLTFVIAVAFGHNTFGYQISNDGSSENEYGWGKQTTKTNNTNHILQTTSSSFGRNISEDIMLSDTGQGSWDTSALDLSTSSDSSSSKSLLISSSTTIAQPVATRGGASENGTASTIGHISVSPVDIIIVSLILITWFIVIGVFIHKWQHLRIVEPREYRFQHKPKNLDSIKIVKRQSDSVIYRAYPVAMTKTMAAREKRLGRMHTMPAIKVDLDSKSPAIKLKKEIESHIPILCLHSMDDSRNISDEEVNEQQYMLKPVQV